MRRLGLLLFFLSTWSCLAQTCQGTRLEAEYYAAAYAKHYGLPVDFVRAVIEQESGWHTCAVSVKGAVGLMQLMPETAASLGVKDRCDVKQNISGGTRYLASLNRKFHGDLRLVAASYYAGEHGRLATWRWLRFLIPGTNSLSSWFFKLPRNAKPKIEMSLPLHAVQHIRRMRGGSQAQLLRASDGAYYVTKFQNSPQGVKILANEMFATSLGLWLGLVLDKWLANADGRQAIFTRRRRGRNFQAIFIDQGYCLNANEWSFPDLPLHGVYARNCVYQNITGWESFEPTLSKAEQADIIDIWRCAEQIVPEWYGHDGDALERIVEMVYIRRQDIRRLIDAFRQSCRNPFPNWKEN